MEIKISDETIPLDILMSELALELGSHIGEVALGRRTLRSLVMGLSNLRS
jgi:hypothetical protein